MSNPVTLNLIGAATTFPVPDNLLVGPKGAEHTEIVKVRVEADAALARGTLLMSGTKDSEKVFLPCTVAGLSVAGTVFAVLADPAEIAADEHAEMAVYLDGDFNPAAVVLPWETDGDDHDEQIELTREPLLRQKIFLRNTHR